MYIIVAVFRLHAHVRGLNKWQHECMILNTYMYVGKNTTQVTSISLSLSPSLPLPLSFPPSPSVSLLSSLPLSLPPSLLPSQEEEQDPLIRALYTLQDILNHTHRLSNLDVTTYLKPFCEIVQSDDTTGPVTGMAISSLDKFLAYGFIGKDWKSYLGRMSYEEITIARE